MHSEFKYIARLRSIQSSRVFKKLDTLITSDVIGEMVLEEKALLCRLLLEYGEELLKQNHLEGLDKLEHAIPLLHQDFELTEKIARIYLQQAIRLKRSDLAEKSIRLFQETIACDLVSCWPWILYIEAMLICSAKEYAFDNRENHLDHALRALQYTLNYLKPTQTEWLSLSYLEGLYYFQLGIDSEEPYDFLQAYKHFSLCEENGLVQQTFLENYAVCCLSLFKILGNLPYLIKGISLKQKIAETAPSFSAWSELGFLNAKAYEFSTQETYFYKANKSFLNASSLSPQGSNELWIEWIKLYLNAYQISGYVPYLDKVFIKISMISQLPDNAIKVMGIYFKALVLKAAAEENIENLQSIRRQVEQSLKLFSEEEELYLTLGMCLYEIGTYFSEDSFYKEAISYLELGACFAPKYTELSVLMADCYFEVGVLNDDESMVHKAITSYKETLLLEPSRALVWLDLGTAYMKLAEISDQAKHFKEALYCFEQSIAVQGGLGEKYLNKESLYNYGCILDFWGDYYDEPEYCSRAIQVLARLIETDKEYKSAHYNLALAYFHRGEMNSSLEDFQFSCYHFDKAAKLNKDDDMFLHDWGLALLHMAVLSEELLMPEESFFIYHEAESKLLHAAVLGNIFVFYHLACLCSLREELSQSMNWMQLALQYHSLPTIEDLIEDDWIENIRDTEAFRLFIEQLKSNQDFY